MKQSAAFHHCGTDGYYVKCLFGKTIYDAVLRMEKKTIIFIFFCGVCIVRYSDKGRMG